MKVNNRVDAGDVRLRANDTQPDMRLTTKFSSALRRLQNREPSSQHSTHKRPIDRDSKARGGETLTFELHEHSSCEPVLSLPVSFSFNPQAAEIEADGVTHSAALRELRRRRAQAHETESPCVEIEHTASGLRCVLSRDNGGWLLSVTQSMPGDADVQALLDELRAHFNAQGLGFIDVVA